MAELIIEPSALASWRRVVSEAAARVSYQLDEDRESYLVFMLQRYLSRPGLVRNVLALRFLEALHENGRVRRAHLRDVGDQCLLYAGLFPEQAERRRVSPTYFIDMGRTAYSEVAEGTEDTLAELYHRLAEAFTPLADVLFALRGSPDAPLLTALEATERSVERGGPAASTELGRHTDATPLHPGSNSRH